MEVSGRVQNFLITAFGLRQKTVEIWDCSINSYVTRA